MTNVFYVDDEEDLVWFTAKRLSTGRSDLSVESFTDPKRALSAFKKAPPDVLVTDLRMEGMNGLDLLAAARKIVPGIPTVLVTAYGSPAVRKEVASLQSIEYLDKPFSIEALRAAIDAAQTKASGFSGNVAQLGLIDLIQMQSLARFSGLLRVTAKEGEASLWFEEGEVQHASAGEIEGEEAVFTAMRWASGSFHTEGGRPTPKRTIKDKCEHLLLKGCQRLDELETNQRNTNNEEGSIPNPLLTQETEMGNVKESLETLGELDGFVGACVADSNSGMMLGSHGGGGIDLETAAAGNTEVVRAKLKTMKALSLNDKIEDILITLGKQYHLIRPVASKEGLFVYLVLEKAKSNLAMGRRILADTESILEV